VSRARRGVFGLRLQGLWENEAELRSGEEAMGALCCCFSSDTNLEDYLPYQNGSLWRECFCLRSCLPWVFAHYDEVNNQDTVFPNQVSTAGGGGLVGGSNVDTSIPEVFQAPPPPLPYDSDPRYLRNAGLISRRDKSGMSHQHAGEPLTLRHSVSDGGTALQRRFSSGGGGGGVDSEEGLKSGGMEKTALSSKSFPRVESALSILDDDDVCPTCLDEYTEENPRITTACGHNFHLACIYEWMERSNRCPICDKEMIFSEV